MYDSAHPLQERTRRHFLGQTGLGLGAVALASLANNHAGQATMVETGNRVRRPHFSGKAKRVIYLHMTGSPPHLDLYDYKPELVKRTGDLCPSEYFDGKRFAFTSEKTRLLGTPRRFRQFGESGTWLSDAVPHFHPIADDMCVIRSMATDEFNHAPAELLLLTGSARAGRPSMGTWVTYGLGSESRNLPGFVVLVSSGVQPNGGKSSFGSGFLPSLYSSSAAHKGTRSCMFPIRKEWIAKCDA